MAETPIGSAIIITMVDIDARVNKNFHNFMAIETHTCLMFMFPVGLPVNVSGRQIHANPDPHGDPVPTET